MRPWRLQDVVHDLSKNGIVGMTASNVMGVGVQRGAQSWLLRELPACKQRCCMNCASGNTEALPNCSSGSVPVGLGISPRVPLHLC